VVPPPRDRSPLAPSRGAVRAALLAGLIAWVEIATPSLLAQDDHFRTGIELVHVTATVSDRDGHFVPSLRKENFAVFENGRPQEIAFFSNERMPVSLGIVLDASGSMTPEKMTAARSAIDRFIFELLDPDDELFFVEFANSPKVAQPWTTDREAISRAVADVVPIGGTALYDAIAAALPVAATGRHRKKALLLISDGNDTNSRRSIEDVQRLIRDSEVLVYALGVDGTERDAPRILRPRAPFPPPRFQIRLPFPGQGGGRMPPRVPPPIGGRGPWQGPPGDRVDADTLRSLTDETGGRAEIVRGFSDLAPATAKLADELRSQYFLGYASTEPKDGRWHAIRVEVRGRRATVRARRGFIAS
jgi:VWFA-related protein